MSGQTAISELLEIKRFSISFLCVRYVTKFFLFVLTWLLFTLRVMDSMRENTNFIDSLHQFRMVKPIKKKSKLWCDLVCCNNSISIRKRMGAICIANFVRTAWNARTVMRRMLTEEQINIIQIYTIHEFASKLILQRLAIYIINNYHRFSPPIGLILFTCNCSLSIKIMIMYKKL